jgi:hypothetical protein
MKTKSSTKIMLALAGSLLAIGGMKAQMVNKDSLISLNKNAIQQIAPGEGHAAGASGFWGYAFGDYSYQGKGDSAGRGTKQWGKGLGANNTGQNTNPNAFEIRRAYLGYDYKINDKFSAYALLAYEGDQDVNDDRTVYLKYMYFKWKGIWKGTDLKIGQQATNSFAADYNTEPEMGYRAIEKTIMDMHGVDGSSDMGIDLSGKLWTATPGDDSKVPTFIGYKIMAGNNSGNNPVAGFTSAATSLSGATTTTTSTYTTNVTVPLTSQKTGKDTTINGISDVQKVVATTTAKSTTTQSLNPFNSTTDNAKKFRGMLFINTLNNALTIGGYADIINYGNKYFGTSKAYLSQVMTEKVYLTYNSKWFGIGGEYFMQTMKNGESETTYNDATGKTTTDTADAEQSGMSVFAHGTIIQNTLNIFVRYDMYTPDNKYSFSYDANSTLANHAAETFTENFSNTSSVSPYKETFMNAGLDWTPTKDKKVHIMPNIWYYTIKNGYGSDNLAQDSYLFYRISFLFAFN